MSLIIYTKTGCRWSDQALEFLQVKGIEHEERDVRINLEFRKELGEKSGQFSSPTIDLNGEILADTDVGEMEVFLKEKGIL